MIQKKLTEWVCPCNIYCGTQIKEKISLTGLLLGANYEYISTNPNQSVLRCKRKHPSPPSTKKFKVTPSTGKVVFTVFWDSQEILFAHFQKRGENVNSASYYEVLLKL
jgi:hypothetical protein